MGYLDHLRDCCSKKMVTVRLPLEGEQLNVIFQDSQKNQKASFGLYLEGLLREILRNIENAGLL